MGALTNIVPMVLRFKGNFSGQEIWDMLEENHKRTFSAVHLLKWAVILSVLGVNCNIQNRKSKDARIQEILSVANQVN